MSWDISAFIISLDIATLKEIIIYITSIKEQRTPGTFETENKIKKNKKKEKAKKEKKELKTKNRKKRKKRKNLKKI